MPDIRIDDNCLLEVERRLDVLLNSNKLEQLENQHAEKLRNRSYVDPRQPSKSTASPNPFGRKTMLCIFWDQEGPIYYEFLKPGEIVNTDRCKQQLLDLNDVILERHEQYKKWQHEGIFLDDNAPSLRAKPTKDIVKALGWKPLAQAPYLPDLAPSDYHLFASLGHALADQRFTYENVKAWLDH
ncbi:mariner Mos1 transposase [Trichonephila clavipes]|nr:mariner Mos1 transposase [Trichonephila clavipes]